MFDWLYTSLRLDDFAVIQIVMMSAVCGFIVSQLMQGWIGPILANAGLFISAVVTNVMLRKANFAITHIKDLDGIIYTAIGLIGGAILVCITILLFSALSNRVGTSAHDLRERDMAS
jgi:hypothetical protein